MDEDHKSAVSSILPRAFEPHLDDTASHLTVAQWNLLSDQLALDFPRVDQKHLEWEFRKALYKQELLRINADIYFLEEIDHPEEICGLLPKDEYNSHYLQKKGWHQDGSLLLYRASRFEEIEVIKRPFESEGCFKQNCIIAVLKDKVSQSKLIAVVSHFKSKKPNGHIRVLEAKELTTVLKQLEAKHGTLPTMIGMDMNDEPMTAPYTIFTDSGFVSGHAAIAGKEEITTFKARSLEGPLQARTIDYLWLKNGSEVTLTPVQSYRLPKPAEMGEEKGLPSAQYPSDHLMLGLRLKLALASKV